jgi:hypothetical protein
VPGAFLLDLFPSRTVLYYYRCLIVFDISLVKHVPEWIPGAGFKTKAKEWQKLSQAIINVPYDMVKEAEKFVSGLSFTLFGSISQLATRTMALRYSILFRLYLLEAKCCQRCCWEGRSSYRRIDQGFCGYFPCRRRRHQLSVCPP